jgi:hypothetical protein
LLSGLLKCGICGGNFSLRRADKFSCFAYHNRGTCTNRLQIRRGDLEGQVLTVLKQQLTTSPYRFAIFCEAYARELEAVRAERRQLVEAYRAELARLEAEYDTLSNTAGGRKTLRNRRAGLESVVAQHQKFSHELKRLLTSPDALEKHYGEYVEELIGLVNRTRRHPDSHDAFRSQIDRVVLKPNDKDTTLLVDVKVVEDRSWRRPGQTGQSGHRRVNSPGVLSCHMNPPV